MPHIPSLRARSRLHPLAVALVTATLGLVGASQALAGGHGRVATQSGMAMQGFDPVAFVHEGTAREGDPDIVLRWRGAYWHFASVAYRAAFEANPKAYAPAFGGHCPVSVADGTPRPGDPRHWAIVEQRLVLASSAEALRILLADPQAILGRAVTRWRAARAN